MKKKICIQMGACTHKNLFKNVDSAKAVLNITFFPSIIILYLPLYLLQSIRNLLRRGHNNFHNYSFIAIG